MESSSTIPPTPLSIHLILIITITSNDDKSHPQNNELKTKIRSHIMNINRNKQFMRSKVRIPIEEGGQFLGILDYTQSLKPNQMFLQIDRSNKNLHKEVIIGKAIVYRDPHPIPNDIRTVELVDIPALSHIVNCAVFPAAGYLPLHLQCSGGDLDGDKYFIIWDSDFIRVNCFPCLFLFFSFIFNF